MAYQELDTGSIVPAPLSVRRNPRHSCGARLSAASCTEPSSSLGFLCRLRFGIHRLSLHPDLSGNPGFFFSFQKTKKSGPELRYFLQCHVWFFLSIFLFSPSASCFPALLDRSRLPKHTVALAIKCFFSYCWPIEFDPSLSSPAYTS